MQPADGPQASIGPPAVTNFYNLQHKRHAPATSLVDYSCCRNRLTSFRRLVGLVRVHMNSPDPSLEEIVSSLTELKQLADVQGLNKIDDLIDLVLIVAID